MLDSIPERNRTVLTFLIRFLREVADKQAQNKYVMGAPCVRAKHTRDTYLRMTESNLGIVFGPNLLWARDQAASLTGTVALDGSLTPQP